MILVIPKKELVDNGATYSDRVGYFITDGKTYNSARDDSELKQVINWTKDGRGWQLGRKPSHLIAFLKEFYPEVFL